MAQNQFKLGLELSLKRIAMISISRTLWMSSEFNSRINDLIEHGELPRMVDYTREMGWEDFNTGDLVVVWYWPCDYTVWEKVTAKVLKKAKLLPVFGKDVRMDLEKIIVLIGEKIFYYLCTRDYDCLECDPTEKHVYSVQQFSPYGTDIDSHYVLHHFKDHPAESDQRFQEFILLACEFCQENIIEQYQEEIIKYLEDRTPGLSFKNKEDVVFNILSVYHYTNNNPYNEDDGKYPLPEQYLNNTDYIVPLEEISRLLIFEQHSTFYFYKYFATKLHSLGALPKLASFLPPLKEEHATVLNHLYRPIYFMDFRTGEILIWMINSISSEEKLVYFQNNLNELIVAFLPTWPFQELVPEILNYCFINNIDVDYKFLLRFVMHCIGIQNKSLHPVHKGVFLNVLQKIWEQTPKNIKLSFLVERTEILVKEKVTREGKTSNARLIQNISSRIKNLYVRMKKYFIVFLVNLSPLLSSFFKPSYFSSFLMKFSNILPAGVLLKYSLLRYSMLRDSSVVPEYSNTLPKMDSLALILNEEDLKTNEVELKSIIFRRCQKIVESEKPGFIKKFVSGLIPSYEESRMFGKEWLDNC